MPAGRPKLFSNPHQLHLLVPGEDYRVLERAAAAGNVPLADFLRGILRQAATAYLGKTPGGPVAIERLERARQRRNQHLTAACAKLEAHARTIARLVESEGPAA
jgi:hypothetical protein